MRISVPKDEEDLIPEGEHFATLELAEPYTGRSGKKTLRWTFIVPQGAMQKRVETYTSLESGKTWKLREFLKVLLGIEEKGDLDFDPNDLLDVACIITISHEEFNNRTQERVDTIVRRATAEDAPADPFAQC